MEKTESVEQTNMPNEAETQGLPVVEEKQNEDKKRKAEEGEEKEAEGENEENPEMKKAKKDLQYPNYQHPTPEDLVSLEALASGSVPDMATAFSIASLSGQPPPNNWAFMTAPGAGTSASETGDSASASQMAQQAQLYQQFLFQQQAWYLQNMQREMQSQMARGEDSGTGLFVLLEHPNEVQRKSYKNENRCLLPNPLTICMRDIPTDEKKAQIADGTVTVTLVDSEGEELPTHKQSILESIERSLSQHLDENYTAQFSLKVMETSEGNMFRLLFTVQYRMKGVGNCEEKILSRPFIVYSNRKKHIKGTSKPSGNLLFISTVDRERPIPSDIKPDRGDANREAEVWIKGRGFGDKVAVNFGDKPAKVIENSDNLITVIPPPCDVGDQDLTVHVTVSNKFARELFTADKKLTYTYLAPK